MSSGDGHRSAITRTKRVDPHGDDQPPPSTATSSHPKRVRLLTDARREQNRAAQQSYRDRKDKRLLELEAEVEALRAQNRDLEAQIRALRGIILTSMNGNATGDASPGSTAPSLLHSNAISPSSAISNSLDPPRFEIRPADLLPFTSLPPQSSSSVQPAVRSALDTRLEQLLNPIGPQVPSKLPMRRSTLPTMPEPSGDSSIATAPLEYSSNVATSLTKVPPNPSGFSPLNINVTPLDPAPSWLSELSALMSGNSDSSTSTLPQAKHAPGMWLSPDDNTSQNEPYNLDNLDFLFNWDAGYSSVAQPDLYGFLDS